MSYCRLRLSAYISLIHFCTLNKFGGKTLYDKIIIAAIHEQG